MPRRRRSFPATSGADLTALGRLWLLRPLVQLNTHRNFIVHGSFNDDTLAEALGFGECINSNDTEPNPGLIRKKLRKLHREAERKLANARPPSVSRPMWRNSRNWSASPHSIAGFSNSPS